MTAYFQTLATVIPVLLIAGMLNPNILRDHSRSELRSRILKGQIIFALIGTFVAATLVAEPGLSRPDSGQWWEWAIYITALIFTAGSLGSTLLFVYYVAKLALDENPHPERLKSEKQKLERRLAIVERRMSDSGGEDPDSTSQGHD